MATSSSSLPDGSSDSPDNHDAVQSQKGISFPASYKTSGRKRLQVAVRIVITLSLFALLLRSVSLPQLFTTLLHAQRSDLLMGLALGILGVILSCYVWRSLVLAEGIKAKLGRLIKLYLIGVAFSHFLPTSMGGDAIKAFYIGKESGNLPGATSAVLMSRITGFVGMLLVALPTLLIFHNALKERVVIGFLLLCLLWVMAIGSAVLVTTLLPRMSTKFLKELWIRQKFVGKLLNFGNVLSESMRRPRAVGASILFGMLFWISNCLAYSAYAAAVGIHLPLFFYFIVIPFASILASLPISISGFGVREGVQVYLFSTMHVVASTALLIVLLMDAQRLLFGLVGGYIYLTIDRKRTRMPTMTS